MPVFQICDSKFHDGRTGGSYLLIMKQLSLAARS